MLLQQALLAVSLLASCTLGRLDLKFTLDTNCLPVGAEDRQEALAIRTSGTSGSYADQPKHW